MVFEKIWNFRFLCFFLIFNRIEVKTINTRIKTKHSFEICIEFSTKLQKRRFFSIFTSYLFFLRVFSWYFQKYAFFDIWPAIKKFWPENWKSLCVTLCQIRCRFQICLCFSSSIDSFWLLFFWRFKSTFYGRGIYIYIYIYIYNY